MNNKRLLTIVFICMFWLIPYVVQAAEDTIDASKSYGVGVSGASLSGGITSADQFFQIEQYWKVSAVDLDLDYKASQLTQSDRSSVTLLLNGTPFHSFQPLLGDAEKQHLKVSVPTSLLIPGFNRLTIQGSLETLRPLQDVACLPTDTTDKWLQIFNTSRISVQHVNEAIKGSIQDFNKHFLGLDTMNEGLSAIAVPERSDSAELETAVYALSGFAKANPLKDKTIPMLAYGAEGVKGKQAVVLVSLYQKLPDPVKSSLSQTELKDRALIQLVNLSGQWTLVVTSENEQLLSKAGRLVGNQALMQQMDGDSKIVDAQTEVETPAVEVSRNVTLTEDGDKLNGDRHREKEYLITLPGNRSVADASKLSLDFRYAKNLDFERSMVTVLLNKTPIGSKKLSSELADGDRLALQIPKNLNISGNFTVTVAFDLELKQADCIQNQDQMPWAYIGKESMLQVNTKDKADLLFNNYPYPFLRDGSYNRVAVVLPATLDAYTYQALTHVFNLLGQYAQTNTGEIRFYSDDVAASELKDRQIIALGSFRNNKIIRDSNSKLYFRYNAEGAGFMSNEKMSIDSKYGQHIGTLQLINSPYGEGQGLLAVTGSGSEYVYLASKLIGTDAMRWKLVGDGVTTDKDGNIRSFRFKKLAEPEPSSILGDVLARKDVVSFTIAVVLVLVLVLVSLILMIRKHKKKTKRGRGR